jgi:hypothetical protein
MQGRSKPVVNADQSNRCSRLRLGVDLFPEVEAGAAGRIDQGLPRAPDPFRKNE